jgi:hypothetical protein
MVNQPVRSRCCMNFASTIRPQAQYYEYDEAVRRRRQIIWQMLSEAQAISL